MAQRETESVRIDKNVVEKIKSNLDKLDAGSPASKGTYECSVSFVGVGDMRVTAVTEKGSKTNNGERKRVNREYKPKSPSTAAKTTSAIDVEQRLLNETLTCPDMDGLQQMLVASQDRNVFGSMIKAEINSIRETSKDQDVKIFFNPYLWDVFNRVKDFKSLKSLIGSRGASKVFCANSGNATQANLKYNAASTERFTVPGFWIGSSGQMELSAAELIEKIPSEAEFEFIRNFMRSGIGYRTAYKTELKAKAMLRHFSSRLEKENGGGLEADVRGEMLAMKVMTMMMTKEYELKYCCTDKKGSTGIDQIWASRNGGEYIEKYMIVECKGSSDAHEGETQIATQMSERWVVDSLLAIADTGGRNKRLADKVLTASAGAAIVIKGSLDQVSPRVKMLEIKSLYGMSGPRGMCFQIVDKGALDLTDSMFW